MISEEQERENEILKELDRAREALNALTDKLMVQTYKTVIKHADIYDLECFAKDKALNAKEALDRFNRKDNDDY